MTAPEARSDELDATDLQTPLLVNLAAAVLAIAAACMVMIGVQIGLSGPSSQLWVMALLAAYFVTGIAGVVSAIAIAKGRSIGAMLGLACALSYLGLFWTPFLMGALALSMLMCAGFAGLAVLLVGVSIPMTRTLEKNRRAFLDSI